MGVLFRLLSLRIPKLTSFFSVYYLVLFLPGSILVYGLAPKKCRPWVLLGLSFAFFWLISGERILYLLLAIFCIYFLGLWLDKQAQSRDAELKRAEKGEKKAIRERWTVKMRRVLMLGLVVLFGALVTVKYSAFLAVNANAVLHFFRSPVQLRVPAFVMPIGISFFTMQAYGYLFDVYRGTVKAERNMGKLSLFLSFFPCIVEGPICRYSQTAESLWEGKALSYDRFTRGAQRIAYGMMKKLVVADRLNAFVEAVFDNGVTGQGGIMALAAVAYTFQLYMDFSGSMDAVLGTGEIFGVEIPENFRQPFFSRTVSEFWTRWHISLGGWFRDVIFYPVTTSAPMKRLTSAGRKKLGNHWGPMLTSGIALLCVWLSNGAWHGAGWNYIFFGLYHFAIIFTGSAIAPWCKTLSDKLRIDRASPAFRVFQTLRTAVLVVVGELFFRATTLSRGMQMMGAILTNFTFSDIAVKNLFLDGADCVILLVTAAIVFAVSLKKEQGTDIRTALAEKTIAVRWLWLAGLVLYIIIFGAYGRGYIPVNPMYANF